MYLTIKNIALALCIGSIVAISVNLNLNAAQAGNNMAAGKMPFDRTALALGFFVFSALFLIKPIKSSR